MKIWKNIKNYEEAYQISNDGQIIRKSRVVTSSCRSNFFIKEKIINGRLDKDGYRLVNLRYNGERTTFKIHRLVAEHFICNPLNKPQVNHKDGNKDNNTVENLEWCTDSENKYHRCRVLKMEHPYFVKQRRLAGIV